jgi:hypothetical protein
VSAGGGGLGFEGERSFLNVCLSGESGREDMVSIQLRREGGEDVKMKKGGWVAWWSKQIKLTSQTLIVATAIVPTKTAKAGNLIFACYQPYVI